MVLQVKPEAPERLAPRTLHQRQQQLDSSCQNCGSRCDGHPALVPSGRGLVGVELGSRSRETEGDLPFYFSQDSPHWHQPHLMRSHQTSLVTPHQCRSVSMVGSRQTGLVHSRHHCPSLASAQQSRQTELEDVGLELRTIADRCSMPIRPRPNPAKEMGKGLELDKSANEQVEMNREVLGGVIALHDGEFLAHENAGRELRRLADEICSENWLPSSVGGDFDPEDSCCVLVREISRELVNDIADQNEMNRELLKAEVDMEIGRELRRIADAICQGPLVEVRDDPGDSGCSKMDSHRRRKYS